MDLALLLDHPLLALTGAAYAAALALYARAFRSTRAAVATAATAVMVLAVGSNAALVAWRWAQAGRPPFESLYESLVLLALCIGVVYLAMERLHRTRVFGPLAAAGALAAIGYAMARWDAEIVKLPPALQSAWFVPHVVAYFLGYASLFVGTVVAALRLVRDEPPARAGSVLGGTLDLDLISYRAIRFGFLLLTVGLLIGSVWAKSAWGDYWIWDPKENWALVSWFVYAGYLHLRRAPRLSGRRAALLAIAGFAVVVFTYVGLALLPTAAESAHVLPQ